MKFSNAFRGCSRSLSLFILACFMQTAFSASPRTDRPEPVQPSSPHSQVLETAVAFNSSFSPRGIPPECIPTGPEICDGTDNDCNELIDDNPIDAILWCQDLDEDNFGSDTITLMECDMPIGFTDVCGDCDDTDPMTFPGADEICDGIDNDCDAQVDENAIDAISWCRDTDGDGFGDPANTLLQCEQPSGYVLDCGDCDDSDPGIGAVCSSDLIFKHGFESG